MTTTAKRKSSAPRKAAVRANGQTNGAPPERPPERFEPRPTDVPEPEPTVVEATEAPLYEAPPPKKYDHPYGDVPIYVFTPKEVKHPGDSMEPIIFPHISVVGADVEFFWELDELDPMHQAFRYMRRANVPRDIQRRVVRLPDDEIARFLNGWFMGVLMPQGVGPPGES